jgi:hypothetical protein
MSNKKAAQQKAALRRLGRLACGSGELLATGFQFGDAGFERLQLGASTVQDFLLDVELLARYQIETGESSTKNGFDILFHVLERTVGNQRAELLGDIVQKGVV